MTLLRDPVAARRYFDAISPVYEPLATTFLWTPQFQGRLLDLLALDATDQVLDAGCGSGATATLLAPRCGSVHGLDVSRAQLRRAFAREDLGDATFVQGDAAALPYADDSFDAVVSVGVVDYWPDPVGALAEARRVSGPGAGLLLAGLASPRIPTLDPAENAHAWLLATGLYGHAEERDAVEWARRAGWRDVTVDRDGPPWYPGLAVVTTARNPG